MTPVYLSIVLAPLIGAIIAGLFPVSRKVAHRVTITGVGISFLLSLLVFYHIVLGGNVDNVNVYTWGISGDVVMSIGFLVDNLTVMMMCTVTFVSWMVHIYTIGYMEDDEHNWEECPGHAGKRSYQRFFAYISLFTFSMLMLVMSNNFLQLFFGWEAVGLVSYLLIGFWFQRDSAVYANLKAFLVNRVGDFGFLLGIGAVLMFFGSLDYAQVFAAAPDHAETTIQLFSGVEWSLMAVICILLFIGAMGKSAQMPLHVWLPDSMEGPTPISALIHAATMVTAGIFMVARMSPLYELSETALSFVLVIGAMTALFMGFLGLVQNDIKRVVAYSTLSQLGYMTVALGASAYTAGVFHLMTHAFFKALLFLGAGSVIIAMHHDQDIRNMGGLKKYMPITYWTALIGSLALIGFPGFAGFFSKDAIIEAVHHAHEIHRFGAGFAYYAVLLGVFVTALYSFRMFFLVFWGNERMDEHTKHHLHETPWVVTLPLVLLAVPSIFAGLLIGPMIFGEFFTGSIFIQEGHNPFAGHHEAHGWLGYLSVAGEFIWHALFHLPVLLAIAGVVVAYLLYVEFTEIPEKIRTKVAPLHRFMVNKYGFDDFNDWFFAGGFRGLGKFLWKNGDETVIDGAMVNGSAGFVHELSKVVRNLQSGFLYHYAFAMILGLLVLLGWYVH